MARVTVEDCVDKVTNRFDLVLLAAQRAREISGGAELTVDRDRDKNPVVALREIADDVVDHEGLKEQLFSTLQRVDEHTEAEEEAETLALLADPQWQPYLVFPGEFVAQERVVTARLPAEATDGSPAKRPLFVLLDATWPEARKMFRKSPYLDKLPVLSLQSEQLSRYRLRRSQRDAHFCTSEVGALCLELAGDTHAAQTLEAYLDVFTNHYLRAKQQLPVDMEDAAHLRLLALAKL